MKSVLAVMTFAAVGLSSAVAQQKIPPVYGVGSSNCGRYFRDVAAQGESARYMYFSWAQGFITASNALLSGENGIVPDLMAKIPSPEQQRIIDDICRADPAMDYSRAAMKLLDKLRAEEGLEPFLK